MKHPCRYPPVVAHSGTSSILSLLNFNWINTSFLFMENKRKADSGELLSLKKIPLLLVFWTFIHLICDSGVWIRSSSFSIQLLGWWNYLFSYNNTCFHQKYVSFSLISFVELVLLKMQERWCSFKLRKVEENSWTLQERSKMFVNT